MNLNSLTNVGDLRYSGSLFHIVVGAYLNERKPLVVVLTQGTISLFDPCRSCGVVFTYTIQLDILASGTIKIATINRS